VSAASLPSLLSSTDPQASGRNGRGASTAADAGPRLLRSLVRGGGRGRRGGRAAAAAVRMCGVWGEGQGGAKSVNGGSAQQHTLLATHRGSRT
jgi:hypothetical protein